jgi:3D-(3,5/4)-trihydroxycyclohexane-1,2-dione acylhydrolase (decyclizing)
MLRAGREFGNEFRAREGGAIGDNGDGALADGRLAGDYIPLDLAKVAEGLGATVYRATTPGEVRAALAGARDASGPVVIVAETLPHVDLPGAGVWWDVAPAEVSDDELVRKLRAEYDADRERLQRYYG